MGSTVDASAWRAFDALIQIDQANRASSFPSYHQLHNTRSHKHSNPLVSRTSHALIASTPSSYTSLTIPLTSPCYHQQTNTTPLQQWLEPSKPPESLPEERLPESNLLPRLPESLPLLLVVSRSPIDTGQELSPCERFDDTKSPPSSSSESSPSSDWFERLPKTSRPTCDSSLLLSWLSRKLLRPISSPSSKTPTWLPSTPSESPSSQRTLLLPEGSVERGPKLLVYTQSSLPSLHTRMVIG